MVMFDDHDAVMMVMMPAVIVMHFGASIETVMIMSDHHFLGTCNRRCGNGNRAKCGNNVPKSLHVILLVLRKE
jgi:hypothetical protein